MLSLSLTVAISNCNALSRFGRSICRWRGFLTGMRLQDCTLFRVHNFTVAAAARMETHPATPASTSCRFLRVVLQW